VDRYFRDTRVRNSSLAACKFERCSFSDPEFVGCTLTFLEFRGCFIPFARFSDALLSDPGYRHRLADELGREASAGGALRDAHEYRLVGEDAYERHVWNLAWASGAPYYEKHRPVPVGVRYGVIWLARKFNRQLWGYGERGLILARSFLIVALLVFPVLFRVFAANELRAPGSSLDVPDYLPFNLDNREQVREPALALGFRADSNFGPHDAPLWWREFEWAVAGSRHGQRPRARRCCSAGAHGLAPPKVRRSYSRPAETRGSVCAGSSGAARACAIAW
jgi:hypothetical protein